MNNYNNLSVTNGKEALEKIKYLTINEPSGYGIYSTQLKDTIHYFIIKKELDELAKYKRSFEIFKGREVQVYPKFDGNTQYVITLNKEEYELLEELMKSE